MLFWLWWSLEPIWYHIGYVIGAQCDFDSGGHWDQFGMAFQYGIPCTRLGFLTLFAEELDFVGIVSN